MRAFLLRRKLQICPTVLCARKKSEKRVFLRASKIRRGFWARALQNFGDKKASKTLIFQIEKSEEKKNLCIRYARYSLAGNFIFHRGIVNQN